MAKIVLESVSKFYGTFAAVDDVSLTIPDKKFVVLLGPSGSGKSTTLLMIAGLESVTSGRILFDGEPVVHLPANKRDIAMVFQNYALYPHMSVADNMGFGLKVRGAKKDFTQSRVREVADMLALNAFLTKRPSQLSGGQRQRVALGRAIVRQPRAFLMDEPLSNLDAKLRAQMRLELRQLQRSLTATFVYVTHDQVEAMMMGDLVAVFESGKIHQVGSADEIYTSPANTFVATFVGTPEMNLVPGTLVGDRGRAIFAGGFTVSGIPSDNVSTMPSSGLLGLRPHEVTAFPDDTSTRGNRLPARVLFDEPMGSDVFLIVDCGARLTVRSAGRQRHSLGSLVLLDFSQTVAQFFDEPGRRICSLRTIEAVVSE